MVTRTVVKAPCVLCIYKDEHRAETLRFLQAIDVLLLKEYKAITVDFSAVKVATAAASLLLFAIINRAQLLRSSSSVVSFHWPNKTSNEDGHRWIVKTGLARALKCGAVDKLAELADEKQFFQSSSEPSIHLFSTIDMLQEKAKLSAEQLQLLSSGISEAMLNVSHHAYEHPKFLEDVKMLGNRWWQCAWFDPRSDATVFIIYDLGIGIFESYNNGCVGGGSKYQENRVVEEALTLGNTRFKRPERGKGSEDIKAPIRNKCAKKESLLIYTGRTAYRYTSLDEKPSISPMNEYVTGTLIEWKVQPLRGIEL